MAAHGQGQPRSRCTPIPCAVGSPSCCSFCCPPRCPGRQRPTAVLTSRVRRRTMSGTTITPIMAMRPQRWMCPIRRVLTNAQLRRLTPTVAIAMGSAQACWRHSPPRRTTAPPPRRLPPAMSRALPTRQPSLNALSGRASPDRRGGFVLLLNLVRACRRCDAAMSRTSTHGRSVWSTRPTSSRPRSTEPWAPWPRCGGPPGQWTVLRSLIDLGSYWTRWSGSEPRLPLKPCAYRLLDRRMPNVDGPTYRGHE